MTMYDIIKGNDDATRVLNAILKCAVASARAGNFQDMFSFLLQWDGAVMMHNGVMGYCSTCTLSFEEDVKIQGYVKRICYKHYNNSPH